MLWIPRHASHSLHSAKAFFSNCRLLLTFYCRNISIRRTRCHPPKKNHTHKQPRLGNTGQKHQQTRTQRSESEKETLWIPWHASNLLHSAKAFFSNFTSDFLLKTIPGKPPGKNTNKHEHTTTTTPSLNL